jgi:Zn-dependent alcohol dehydrogenase
LLEQKNPLKIQCFKKANPTGHQVLVRIYKSGVCGAQLNEILGVKGPDAYLPHLLGHEGSGVVEEIGPLVSKVAPGDRVVLHWRKARGGEGPFPRYQADSGETVGGGHVTTFADRALISENRVTKIDSDIPFDVACLFGCGISTGYGIVHNELQLRAGATLAVVGCGGVGLNVVQAAALSKASKIVAVDRRAGSKENLALTMGATKFIVHDDNGSLSEQLRAEVPSGFDAIVDTTGSTRLMEQAFTALTKSGTLMLVGQPHAGSSLTLCPALDLFTGKKLLVSEGGGFDPDRDMPKLMDLYRSNPEGMLRVITHQYSLDQINEAFSTLQSGQCGRILINMN